MTKRGLTFGAVAEAYEQIRPGFPDEVVDVVLDGARLVRFALEMGASTGKATWRSPAARSQPLIRTRPYW